MPAIVERLRLWGINQLYVIGGNGGNAAAHAIAKVGRCTGACCHAAYAVKFAGSTTRCHVLRMFMKSPS